MKRNTGILSLLLSILLCLTIAGPASAEEPASGEVGTRSIEVTVRELTPGYYLCAVWDGTELLTLFDATVGSDGILNQTVEVGRELKQSDTLKVGISGANTGEDAAAYNVVLAGPETPPTEVPGNKPDDTPTGGPIFGGWIPVGGSVPTTYSVTAPSAAGGTVAVSPKSAAKGTSVTVTATPEVGYELATLTVSDQDGRSLALTDKGGGRYTFTMPGGKVTVNAEFREIPQPQEPEAAPWSSPFPDVSEDAWYYDAVRFACEGGLMRGYENGLFAPNAPLSRAQLAQILYNQKGTPYVTAASAFTDVSAGAWYADAVTWAAEQGIVSGYGDGRFGPTDNITREQLAVMLWRYAGTPAAADGNLVFRDVEDISAYALEAMRWSVENQIISGYSGGLDPKGSATRAQTAQMLQNYLER